MKLPAWIFRTRYQSTTLYYLKTSLKSFVGCSINHFCASWTKNIVVRLRLLFTTLSVSIHESFTIWNVIRNLFSDAGFHKLRSTQHRGNLKLPIRSNTPFRTPTKVGVIEHLDFFFNSLNVFAAFEIIIIKPVEIMVKSFQRWSGLFKSVLDKLF